MVTTYAAGEKEPLFIVGISKLPHCIKYLNNIKFPLPYTNKFNALFDINITVHWINKVL